MNFIDLKISEPILKALSKEGYSKPTPIQVQAIPSLLEGRDLLGCAQTGTGKTAAFAIPIIQMMSKTTKNGKKGTTKSLILTPTRELAIQIADSFDKYGKFLNLKCTVVFGGVNQYHQVQSLKNGVDILVATPGRLLDLMNQGYIHLGELDYFVLDEADRMLDMGFVHDVKKVIAKLPAKRQSLFFSATMPPPIQQLAQSILTNPVKVEVAPVSSTADTIEQVVYFVDKENKQKLLLEVLKDKQIDRALVFARTKHGSDKLAKYLNNHGVKTQAIHGNKSQTARQKALSDFKNKDIQILIATDIASRGIDIDQLTHVINFELPNIPESYVHRIGRTGRAGNAGRAIALCDGSEKAFLKDIERLIGKQIPIVENDLFPFMNKDAEVKPTKEKSGNQRRSAVSGNSNKRRSNFSRSRSTEKSW